MLENFKVSGFANYPFCCKHHSVIMYGRQIVFINLAFTKSIFTKSIYTESRLMETICLPIVFSTGDLFKNIVIICTRYFMNPSSGNKYIS